MPRATIEFDFFGLEKQKSAASSASQSSPPVPHKSMHHRRNFLGIQNTTSRINPELVKSVIASNSLPYTPVVDRQIKPSSPPLPFYVPHNTLEMEISKETPPLTIFYNGTVSVFNVPQNKAESILKAAMEVSSKSVEESASTKVGGGPSSGDQKQLTIVGPTMSGDLPLFRRMSLQRFLEKRKARRLNFFSPYNCNNNNSSRVFWQEDDKMPRHLQLEWIGDGQILE